MGRKSINPKVMVTGFLNEIYAAQREGNGVINRLHVTEKKYRLGYYQMAEVLDDCGIILQITSKDRFKRYRWIGITDVDDDMITDVLAAMDKYRTHRTAVLRATGKFQRDPDRTARDLLSETDSKRLHRLNTELSTLRKGYLELSSSFKLLEALVKLLEKRLELLEGKTPVFEQLFGNLYKAPPALPFPLQKLADRAQLKKVDKTFFDPYEEEDSPKR